MMFEQFIPASIPHNKLVKTLNSVIAFPFHGSSPNKMSINNYDIAYWCKFMCLLKNILCLLSIILKSILYVSLDSATLLLTIKFFNK